MKKLGLLLLTLLLVVSCGRDPKGTVDKFIKKYFVVSKIIFTFV